MRMITYVIRSMETGFQIALSADGVITPDSLVWMEFIDPTFVLSKQISASTISFANLQSYEALKSGDCVQLGVLKEYTSGPNNVLPLFYNVIPISEPDQDFMLLDEKQVVRYLAAMKATNRTEVLSKFKTPEEQAKRIALLEQLNNYGKIEIADAD